MEADTVDDAYRAEIESFSAYIRLKESDGLIEGFFTSGHLIQSLHFDPSVIANCDRVVGLTGSIGRREAHGKHSDYDVAVITREPGTRDAAIRHLMQSNPWAHFDRRSLFKKGKVKPDAERIRQIYYPAINPENLRHSESVMQRVWLLTEFTPLAITSTYAEVQRELINYYELFSTPELYAKPFKLIEDFTRYPEAFAKSLDGTAYLEETEQAGVTTHAKTIMLRKFAHLFNLLAVLRLICRKEHVISLRDESSISNAIFYHLRAPTLIRVGYWFSNDFHHGAPMQRFASESNLSASATVFEKYLEFLKGKGKDELSAIEIGRLSVVLKLCEDLKPEKDLVRRLFKRTCVELIENYNNGVKRIWTGRVREHLAGVKSGPSRLVSNDSELDNIFELSEKVLWPLYALAKLLSITFEVADSWAYFERATYQSSGRAVATNRLLLETRKMLGHS